MAPYQSIQDIGFHRPQSRPSGQWALSKSLQTRDLSAERGSRWAVDVDTVAINRFHPGATARPVRADEPDLDALRCGDGEQGKYKQGEEGDRKHTPWCTLRRALDLGLGLD